MKAKHKIESPNLAESVIMAFDRPTERKKKEWGKLEISTRGIV